MKYNINKMQNGGGIPAFTMLLPILVNNASSKRYDYGMEWDSSSSSSGSRSSKSSSSNSEDDSKGLITDKDILSYLKELNGLESDISGIFKELKLFYALRNYGALNTDDLAMKAIQIMHKIKIANNNAKEWQDAYENAENKNSFGEFAVTGHDLVYVLNEDGEIDLIDADNYLEDKELYRPLTNEELLSLRAHNAPFNNNILRVVNESTSLTEIGNTIKNLLIHLGKESESTSWYQRQTAEQVLTGIDAILKAVAEGADIQNEGIESLFAITNLTENQIKAAQFAISYIEKLLPNNQKTLLKLNLDGDEDKIHALIVDCVSSTMSYTKKNSNIPKKDPNASSNSSKSSGKSSSSGGVEEYMDLFTNIILGKGGSSGKYSLKIGNGNYSINSVVYPDLNLSPSNIIGNGTLEHFLNYGFSSILTDGSYAMTFGDLPIEKTDYNNIVYLNDSKSSRVLLPTKRDKETGLLVPDFNFVEEHLELVNLINTKGLKDNQVLEKLKEEHIIDEATGLPDVKIFLPYLCINGLASSEFVNPNSEFVDKTNDEKLIDLYDKYRANEDGKIENKFDKESYWPGDWFGLYLKLYKGTIFMPLTQNPTQTQIGAGTNVKVSNADSYEQEYLIGDFNRLSGLRSTSSQQLLN